MLQPTSADVLRCIERTLESVIVPSLRATPERSAAATIGHLLRHVVLRITHEGRLLYLEIERLRPLLQEALHVFEHEFTSDPETHAAHATITASLAPRRAANSYRDVADLAAEVTALRKGVCDVLTVIHRHEASLPAGATKLYASLKQYISWALDNESELIDPAFEGFGPRR